MPIVLSFLLLLFSATNGYAQTPQVERVDVLEYGTFTAEISKVREHETTTTRMHETLTDVKNTSVTETIPMKLGIRFGFRYVVLGTPEGALVPIRMLRRFPAVGLRNPDTHRTDALEDYVVTIRIGEESYTDYALAHQWEMVPGPWIFEIWSGDRKLASKTFTLVNR